MINFACKKIDLEDVFRCSFNLKKTDYKILIKLMKSGKALSSIELSKSLNLDRTTIQKALKKLLIKELIKREQRNLTSGGYAYLYSVQDKALIKNHIINLLNNWQAKVKEELGKL